MRMRSLGLYPKILVSFLFLLFLVQALMIGSFMLLDGPPPREENDGKWTGLALLSKELVSRDLRRASVAGKELTALVEKLASLTESRVWLMDRGRQVASSSGLDLPALPPEGGRQWQHKKGFNLLPLRPGSLILSVPVAAAALPRARIILQFTHPGGPPPPHRLFLGRLAIICLLMAMLVVPVSRLIARPIKRLRRSALMIADGDLSHRAEVESNDQIGELARAFNHMTSRLEQMILASRELLAYVSHELRSPLARIVVAGQMLSDGLERNDFQNCRRYLDDIQDEIQQMDQLLAGILMLSRLELQQAPFKRQPLDLSRLLSGLMEKWSNWLAAKDLRMQSDLAAKAPLLGDEEALTSALSNLLDNAAKHSMPGGLVRLSLERAGHGLRLCISNPARPLSREELAHVFEPFFRAEGGDSRGSGLGLALAKKILEEHGGGLTAAYGDGDFTITAELPAL